MDLEDGVDVDFGLSGGVAAARLNGRNAAMMNVSLQQRLELAQTVRDTGHQLMVRRERRRRRRKRQRQKIRYYNSLTKVNSLQEGSNNKMR